MSTDDTPVSTLLAAILGVLVFSAAVGYAEWWLARRWPLWLFLVFQVGSGIASAIVKDVVKRRKQQRAKVRAAEAIIGRSRSWPNRTA